MAEIKKPFLVRGKITFALSVEAEDAHSASDRVRDSLDWLAAGLLVRDGEGGGSHAVHEWEVLTEQIERSE